MGKSRLSQIERGDVALDSLSEMVALANALQVVASELIRLPLPAPANETTDSATRAVRGALMAVNRGRPGGQVIPADALRDRITATLAAPPLSASRNCSPAPFLVRLGELPGVVIRLAQVFSHAPDGLYLSPAMSVPLSKEPATSSRTNGRAGTDGGGGPVLCR
jgi:transcriptional regulator with XRE-family HTH domain